MKIVSLQIVELGDYDPGTDNNECTPQPLIVRVNHNYPYGGGRVESIEFGWSADDFDIPTPPSYYYKVTTADGHIRMLPAISYIEELEEETDDQTN